MLSKTRGIVLHSIPYNDKYSIIYMYTEAFGRVSYLVARGRGRKSNVSKSLFIPFSVMEMEVDHQPRRDLHRIRESKACFPIPDICCNPIKNILALFLAEVLYRAVKEPEPDSKLFHYLFSSIHLLEHTEEGVANYHIVFLLGLLHYLGLFPHVETYREGYYFDMLNGCFSGSIPMHSHYLDAADSKVFASLLRISYENMSFYSFSRHDRVAILHRILEYYRLHLPDFPDIKSMSIMQSLFD